MSRWGAEAKIRDLIFDHAEAYIRRIGHKKTNVADIADTLGTSRANIYRFFPTRGAIDHSVFARLADDTLSAVTRIAEGPDPASARLVTILLVLHRRIREDLFHAPNVQALYVAAYLDNWTVTRVYVQQLTAILAKVLHEMNASSQTTTVGSAEAAQAVVDAMSSFLHPVLVALRLKNQNDIDMELRSDRIRSVCPRRLRSIVRQNAKRVGRQIMGIV
ncbi:TetR family transcriptional regulator [Rhizobium sp. CCGE 510]|uniref:TetR family transcriptional regulator n=1 Tax=Rhizobium sp. CCGE 510 TaxID=1132836 RepID=UPI00027B7DFB|nr:TetR family transcriptional regulator [Rhizobium sp. CCGE 510]EJT06457.1 TetR family transcriptional regulator [Rhizobium sp. CCGE 510]